MPEMIGVAAGFLLVLAFGALVRQGFQDGDRAGDAVARAEIVEVPTLEGGSDWAEVTIDNQNDSPALASVRVRSTSPAWLVLREPVCRRTARPGRLRISGLEPLGIVEGRGEGSWLVPIGAMGRRAVRITVVIYQIERRIRIFTFICSVRRSDRRRSPHPSRAGRFEGLE